MVHAANAPDVQADGQKLGHHISFSESTAIAGFSENASLLNAIQAWSEPNHQHIDQWHQSPKLDTSCISIVRNCAKIIAVSTL